MWQASEPASPPWTRAGTARRRGGTVLPCSPADHISPGGCGSLPFADASFDGVISTFGVIFAGDQERAARELGRVCRPGGRLVLVVWAPEGAIQEFWALIGKYRPGPPPPVSPSWGEPDHVRTLLGNAFDLVFEPGVNDHFVDNVEEAWNGYARGFGPMKFLIDNLPPDQLAAFKQEVDAYHASYRTEAGLHLKREYLLIIGRRR
jgi:SAM-dependent methyltransferase